MKERGKGVEASIGYNESDYSYFSSDLQCKKHPSSNSGGICAYCLKDRLIKLVCSDCGEQRLSSCSCSDVSPYRNSCSTVEVGSVGRISFLIENEKTETQSSNSKPKKGEKTEQFVLLKRSNSSCVEVKRSNGFWRIGRLFRKKREKGGFDDKSDMWVSDYNGVSRSRSLCSFRVGGGVVNDTDHEGSDFAFSSAKISDVNGIPPLDSSETEGRKSGFKGLLDGESCSSVQKSVFGVKESDFSRMDESGFIDLKLDLSSEPKPESKTECSAMKMSEVPIPIPISFSGVGSFREEGFVGNQEFGGGIFGNGGSCRITVNERGIKKGKKKGHSKVWRWIFKQNPGWRSASTKEGENHL